MYISGREEKTKECGLLSGPLSADSPFGRLRHQTTIGRQGGGLGVTDTLLVVSVDKYNRQTDWAADSLLCSDCDGIGSWKMRSNLVRAP